MTSGRGDDEAVAVEDDWRITFWRCEWACALEEAQGDFGQFESLLVLR